MTCEAIHPQCAVRW